MEHLSNDHKDHLNQHENSLRLCEEMGASIMNLMETQWKLRQQLDQNFQMKGKPFWNIYLASGERTKSKRAGLWESQSRVRVGKLTI